MKKTKILITALMVVSIAAVGLTFAYMKATTKTTVNTFTANKGIALELRETTWDGYEFGETYPNGSIPGTVAKAKDDKTLGINKANSYYPKDVIPKDPTVKNVSLSEDAEYVAMKVEYIVGDKAVTREVFEANYAELQYDTTNQINSDFEEISTNETYDVFFLKQPLAFNSTATLFKNIVINEGIMPDGAQYPSFQIKVTAYGVQVPNQTLDDAKTQLLALASETSN